MRSDEAACQQCGAIHALDKLELTFFRPDAVIDLPENARKQDVLESDDLCVIRNEHYFVRATLPLPVHASEIPYRLGVWVQTSEAAFRRIYMLWSDESQANEPPFEVTIANRISTLPDTRGLAASLQLTGPKTRPDVFVAVVGHPITDQQRNGITAHRAYEYTTSAR
ncbi:DUF2199 domain-containing protein [Dyella monticola]|nr:DUF2199 domain-containing protein [Dyella monticola]